MFHSPKAVSRTSSLLLIGSCLLFLQSIVAAGGPSKERKRDAADPGSTCVDPFVNPTAQCYVDLKIDEYIDSWWAKNSADCTSGVYAPDGFASCYQQKLGYLGGQCDTVDVGGCQPPTNFTEHSPQEFYVLMSTFNMWKYFTSIYFATDFANGVASNRIGKIVTELNPTKTDNAAGIALSVLTAGLGFLDLPAKAAGSALQAVKAAASNPLAGARSGSLQIALQQAPGMGKALYQPATLAGQFNEVNQISDTLAGVIQTFQKNIANGLFELMHNITYFKGFAKDGNFIVPPSSLNVSTTILTDMLTTFITSQALEAKGTWVQLYPRAASLDQLKSGRGHFFELAARKDNEGPNDMAMIIRNGWSSRELLIYGAVDCAVKTVAANGKPYEDATLNELDLSGTCISNLKVIIPKVVNRPRAQGCVPKCPKGGGGGNRDGPVVNELNALGGLTQREYVRQNAPNVDAFLIGRGLP